jgi:hypothetical protein
VAPGFRRPRFLPRTSPRKLGAAEVAAIKQRPWPRLPWWLWTVVVLALAAAVVVATLILVTATSRPAEISLGARRSPPGAGLTHDVGPWTAAALRPGQAGVVVERATCPRLANLRLAGTPAEVSSLREAASAVCALRSTGGIDAARTGLDQADAVVAFADFTATGNESTAVLRPAEGLQLHGARVAVLLNAKFRRNAAARAVPLLIHEGAHLAAGAEDAEAEVAAREAEVIACDRVFALGGLEPNRGCEDARALLAPGRDEALAELRAAGYP